MKGVAKVEIQVSGEIIFELTPEGAMTVIDANVGASYDADCNTDTPTPKSQIAHLITSCVHAALLKATHEAAAKLKERGSSMVSADFLKVDPKDPVH